MPHKPTRYGTLNDRVGHDAQEVLVMLPLPLACRVVAHTAPCGHPIQPPQPTQRLNTRQSTHVARGWTKNTQLSYT